MLNAPPSETPNRCARWRPTASITARMSSTRSGKVGGCFMGSESPVPRLSNNTSRPNDPSRCRNRARYGQSQAASTCDTNPGTSSRSGGPEPRTWWAMCTCPLRAYLVTGPTPARLAIILTRKPPARGAVLGQAAAPYSGTTFLCGRSRLVPLCRSVSFPYPPGRSRLTGGRGRSIDAAAARLAVPGSAGRGASRDISTSGECLHVLGGQRVPADRPIAAVHLFQYAPGHPAHVLTLDRHHRIGEFLHNLPALRAGENALNHLDIN